MERAPTIQSLIFPTQPTHSRQASRRTLPTVLTQRQDTDQDQETDDMNNCCFSISPLSPPERDAVGDQAWNPSVEQSGLGIFLGKRTTRPVDCSPLLERYLADSQLHPKSDVDKEATTSTSAHHQLTMQPGVVGASNFGSIPSRSSEITSSVRSYLNSARKPAEGSPSSLLQSLSLETKIVVDGTALQGVQTRTPPPPTQSKVRTNARKARGHNGLLSIVPPRVPEGSIVRQDQGRLSTSSVLVPVSAEGEQIWFTVRSLPSTPCATQSHSSGPEIIVTHDSLPFEPPPAPVLAEFPPEAKDAPVRHSGSQTEDTITGPPAERERPSQRGTLDSPPTQARFAGPLTPESAFPPPEVRKRRSTTEGSPIDRITALACSRSVQMSSSDSGRSSPSRESTKTQDTNAEQTGYVNQGPRRIRFALPDPHDSALRLFIPSSFQPQRSPDCVQDEDQEEPSLNSGPLTATIHGPRLIRHPDSPYPFTPFAGDDTQSPRSAILPLLLDPNLEQLFENSLSGPTALVSRSRYIYRYFRVEG